MQNVAKRRTSICILIRAKRLAPDCSDRILIIGYSLEMKHVLFGMQSTVDRSSIRFILILRSLSWIAICRYLRGAFLDSVSGCAM